jgi:anti-sigma-K factor RskA
MIAERHEELASLYAFGLLEGGELDQFEAALARDAELQTLVADLTSTAATLALTAPAATPSAALKARVLGHIAALPAPHAVAPVVPFRTSFWLPLAAAAGFAFTAVWFGQLYFVTRAENSLLRDQQALADAALESTRNQLEAERLLARHERADASARLAALTTQMQEQSDLARFKIATLASLLDNSPQALAVAVWNPTTQEGVLTVEKLPAVAPGQDYQLWVVDPQYPIPVDGGVFSVDPATGEARYRFKADKPVKSIAKFAVSLERKGGVPKAEGPMVLLSQ